MSDLLSSEYFGEPISEQSEENDVDSQTLVISWLNEAALADNITKIELLRKIQEIILHKDKNLLGGFLDNVLAFCADPSQEVRKVIVGFIEDACKTDGSVLPRISQYFGILLNDELIHVQKRAVQAFSAIYRASLHYLCITSPVNEQLERAWLQLCNYKASIINMIDNDNDGIRTNAIKCLEGIILMQTYADRDNEISRKPTGHDLSLEDIPLTLKVARRRKLEEEAIEIFTLLVRFHNSQHISSVNLMACMGSICTIAKMRPQFMPKVISALENLQTNLPPTLSNSQESSVRKHLKLQLFNLLKHPASMDMHNKITQLLSELGATNQEITKAVPKIDKAEERRRQKRILEREIERYNNSKKARLELPVEQEVKPKEKVYEMEVDIDEVIRQKEEAIDINDKFTFEKIKNIDTVVNLVMTTMLRLPDKLPAHFVQEYKPIANAGTQGHVKALSKMLAENITTGSLGPGAKAINKDPPMRQKVTKEEEQSIIMAPLKRDVEIPAIPETGEAEISEAVKAEATKKLQENMDRNRMEVSLKLKQRVKTLKLQEITKPLSKDVRERLLLNAVQRIVLTERRARCGALTRERIKIITTLAATFKQNVRDTILNFILEDTKSRLDLFFSWLYEEYSLLQGFIRQSVFKPNEKPDLNYNWVLCSLVRNASIGIDPKEFELILNRIYLEAPAITEEALGELVSICEDPQYGEGALKLMADLVIKRPPKQLQYIHLLLKFTIHENESLRAASIALALQLYRHSENLANQVEDCATTQMNYLTLASPPEHVFGASLGRPVKAENWTDDLNRACLSLFIGLLPMNQVLIHDLCRVYIMANADIKRTMLRMLESPVRSMGMDSPDLLRLVETCNKGAETLVTRVIHILTEKAPPSAELVTRVRELYQSRVSDVRFLIPVLNGLTKKEILAALPKLIKLNPVVVKEVFNKLLNTHADARNFPSPVTPAELIVALHMIDPTKAELKFVVKATSLCLAEKEAYTQEVLAVAMQQLMEVTPLPTLLMRTVIQSLGLYPRLSGFVMNILQRLILKQVWKQKVVWDGFLKCCQRTKPQSLQVLMQLPPPQLTEAMQACPDLRPALQDHLNSFSENQRMHVPQTVQDAIMVSAMPMDTSSLTKIELTESPLEAPGSMLMEPIPPGMD